MELLYFYLTVIVQLISVIASAACLAVYLVSHRRTFLFAFWAFLFYFIDVSLIFQDEFVSIATNLESDPLYLTLRSLGSMVSGGGIYISLWLLVCDFVGEKRTALLAAPGVVFIIGSLAALFLIPSSPLARFAFYSMRTLLLFWIVAFIAFRYITTLDPTSGAECDATKRSISPSQSEGPASSSKTLLRSSTEYRFSLQRISTANATIRKKFSCLSAR